MNQSLMTEFKEDLKDFREMTEKFYAKEVSVKDYKGFSGGFGSQLMRLLLMMLEECILRPVRLCSSMILA